MSANFIFADLNGTISAWNASLGTNGSTAEVEVTTPGAVYTGLAVNEAHTMLYAANDSAGTIDVFNSSFDPVDLALQLPTCFEMRTLSGGLVRSAPE
jgi:DNA-binding beta-propeller fold protein YncE